MDGSALDAVRRDVERLPVEHRDGGLAAVALRLARTLDSDLDPRDEATIGRELRACLTELSKLAPAQPQRDALDELERRRADRRANAANQ